MRKRRGQVIDGWLLLDKPVDLSSNHALQRAKRLMDAQKAGHTGTLDPFATGLLICCFGRATKIAGHLLEADKTYTATLLFGVETDSGDLTGEVVSQADASFEGVSQEALEAVLPNFRGVISQVPPMTSALKHKGRPLYAYAREGITIDRPPREVTIHELDVLSCEGRTASVKVSCSKGTYVRTLAQDIGRALGVGAHLVALRRDSVGTFDIKDAFTLEQIAELASPLTAVRSLSELPADLSQIFIKGSAIEPSQL
jgi:tRNA pseudouridine55 synthase